MGAHAGAQLDGGKYNFLPQLGRVPWGLGGRLRESANRTQKMTSPSSTAS